MSRFATLALAAVLSTFAVPAFAAVHAPVVAVRHEGNGEKKAFPIAADEFRAHFAQRTEKMRARMEEHLAKNNVAQDKADEIRARFNAGVAKISEKVEAVCADGTVTKEEAHEVREVAKQVMPHHGAHEHGDKHPALLHVRAPRISCEVGVCRAQA
jgi:predicted secreted protein